MSWVLTQAISEPAREKIDQSLQERESRNVLNTRTRNLESKRGTPICASKLCNSVMRIPIPSRLPSAAPPWEAQMLCWLAFGEHEAGWLDPCSPNTSWTRFWQYSVTLLHVYVVTLLRGAFATVLLCYWRGGGVAALLRCWIDF